MTSHDGFQIRVIIASSTSSACRIRSIWVDQMHLEVEKLAQQEYLSNLRGIFSVLDFCDPPQGTVEMFGKIALRQSFSEPGSTYMVSQYGCTGNRHCRRIWIVPHVHDLAVSRSGVKLICFPLGIHWACFPFGWLTARSAYVAD